MISLLTFLLRLGLALLPGAVIGFERESTEHAAGMRTNALVSLGSCLFTLISGYGFLDFLTIAHMQVDPTRIASYVVVVSASSARAALCLNRMRIRSKASPQRLLSGWWQPLAWPVGPVYYW